MMIETVAALLAVAGGGIGLARHRRVRLYGRLERQAALIRRSVSLATDGLLQRETPDFRDRLACVPGALPAETVEILRRQTMALVRSERSYVPTHKKGGTVAYETLFDAAPAVIALYHSEALRAFVSRIVGEQVKLTPISDQSSLSVLFYEKPGDHIGWHYDHNFYRGRHFTVLLPILNEGGAAGGLSHAGLSVRIGGRDVELPTPPNTLVVFEGARVHHKVSPIRDGERRLVISMTFSTDPRANVLQGAARRIKDVAFFGPRALWT